MDELPPQDMPQDEVQLPARVVQRRSIGHRSQPTPRRDRSSEASGGGESLSPAFLLAIVRKWWKWTIPIGLSLAAGAAAAVIHFHIPEYEAKALISIESSAPFIAFAEDGLPQRSGRFVETQIELIRSPVVLNKVLASEKAASTNDLRMAADPLAVLTANLSIRRVGNSDLYDLRYRSKSAKDAAIIANAIVTQYLDGHTLQANDLTTRVIGVLENEQEAREGAIKDLREKVVEIAKTTTGRDPFSEDHVTDMDLALSPASLVLRSLAEIDVKREMLNAEIKSLRDSPLTQEDPAKTSGLLDLEISQRPEVLHLKNQMEISRLTMDQIKEASLKWESHPEFLKHKDYITRLEKELQKVKDQAREIVLATREAMRTQEYERVIAQKQRELTTLDAQKQSWAKKLDGHMEKMKLTEGQGVKLEFARAELAREERVYELIAARKLALETERQAPARVELKMTASEPKTAIEPIPYKIIFVACMAALACPVAVAAGWELLSKKIVTTDQLLSDTNVRVLGEVSHFPVRPIASAPRRLSRNAQRQMFLFAESIDSIRTNLTLSQSHGGAESRVYAVVSAASGEGKTSVATSLAVSFSGATKKRTLLIDADLRSPDAASVLGIANSPGLAEFLASKVSLNEVIHRVGDSSTYVLPAGKVRGNPHHLVQHAKIEKLIEMLKKEFAIIVIDTPPVLAASEALVYAKAADHVIYCTLRDVSRSSQVKLAISRLNDSGARLAGSVLSGMPCSKYAQYYGVYGHESRLQ